MFLILIPNVVFITCIYIIKHSQHLLLISIFTGTRRERGLAAWSLGESQNPEFKSQLEEGLDVYEIPILTKYFSCLKCLPVSPTFTSSNFRCLKQNSEQKITEPQTT